MTKSDERLEELENLINELESEIKVYESDKIVSWRENLPTVTSLSNPLDQKTNTTEIPIESSSSLVSRVGHYFSSESFRSTSLFKLFATLKTAREKDDYDNRFVIAIMTQEELWSFTHSDVRKKLKIFHSKIKEKHPDAKTALIFFDPNEGFDKEDLALLKRIRNKNQKTKIHLSAHHGRHGAFSSLGLSVSLTIDQLSKILMGILPQKLESQKVTIDLICCEAARVGTNLKPSTAQQLIYKLPPNVKIIARNELIYLDEYGVMTTSIPEKDAEVTEEKLPQSIIIEIKATKLKEKVEKDRVISRDVITSLSRRIGYISESFFDRNRVAKFPGSKLIFSRDEKDQINIRYSVNGDKPLPALSGAIQFGHVRFLKSLLQNDVFRAQLESNIDQYLIDALNRGNATITLELLKYYQNPPINSSKKQIDDNHYDLINLFYNHLQDITLQLNSLVCNQEKAELAYTEAKKNYRPVMDIKNNNDPDFRKIYKNIQAVKSNHLRILLLKDYIHLIYISHLIECEEKKDTTHNSIEAIIMHHLKKLTHIPYWYTREEGRIFMSRDVVGIGYINHYHSLEKICNDIQKNRLSESGFTAKPPQALFELILAIKLYYNEGLRPSVMDHTMGEILSIFREKYRIPVATSSHPQRGITING